MLTKSSNSEHTVSLRARMISCFVAFGAIVLAVLWLSETVFLDDIYRFLKMNELNKCSDEVCRAATSSEDFDEFDTVLSRLSMKYGVCVTVYEIRGNSGSTAAEKHVNSFCFIHNVRNDEILNRLYTACRDGGGECTETVKIDENFVNPSANAGTVQGDFERSGEKTKNGSASDMSDNLGVNVIVARLLPTAGNSELLLLFNTELVPLDSTVKTLRIQLAFISVALIIIAVLLAVIFSGNISKPFNRMCREAGKLAVGDYNVNFDGGNCTETVALSETLNRAAYELSRLDSMRKDLIANVSHDLRTPLTMISGYTEAMRDLPGEATPENMQIVIDETNRLTSLVNDMLEISRYQGGKQTLNITHFNFTEVIGTTLERYGRLRERDGYTIRFEKDRDVYVDADEGRILQVLYNLINNAVNYTGEDKTVIIRQSVVNEEDGEYVLLEVIDTGIGIQKEDLPLVWERYYKVNDFHKRANMGTGLGLSIVKNILLLHGAPFGVESKPGEGSDFWFKLKCE